MINCAVPDNGEHTDLQTENFKMDEFATARFTCERCNMTFKTEYMLSLHMLHTYGEYCYRCMICYEGFHSRSRLMKHLPKHKKDMEDRQKIESGDWSPKPVVLVKSQDCLKKLNPKSSFGEKEGLSAETILEHDYCRDKRKQEIVVNRVELEVLKNKKRKTDLYKVSNVQLLSREEIDTEISNIDDDLSKINKTISMLSCLQEKQEVHSPSGEKLRENDNIIRAEKRAEKHLALLSTQKYSDLNNLEYMQHYSGTVGIAEQVKLSRTEHSPAVGEQTSQETMNYIVRRKITGEQGSQKVQTKAEVLTYVQEETSKEQGHQTVDGFYFIRYCIFCGLRLTRLNELQKHFEQELIAKEDVHQIIYWELLQLRNKEMSTMAFVNLLARLQKEHGNQILKCYFCKRCTTPNSLAEHLVKCLITRRIYFPAKEIQHGVMQPEVKLSNKMICVDCDFTALNAIEMIKHYWILHCRTKSEVKELMECSSNSTVLEHDLCCRMCQFKVDLDSKDVLFKHMQIIHFWKKTQIASPVVVSLKDTERSKQSLMPHDRIIVMAQENAHQEVKSKCKINRKQLEEDKKKTCAKDTCKANSAYSGSDKSRKTCTAEVKDEGGNTFPKKMSLCKEDHQYAKKESSIQETNDLQAVKIGKTVNTYQIDNARVVRVLKKPKVTIIQCLPTDQLDSKAKLMTDKNIWNSNDPVPDFKIINETNVVDTKAVAKSILNFQIGSHSTTST